MIKSIAAGIAAIVLIVGALWVRTNLIESGDDSVAGEENSVDQGDLDDLRIACDATLGSACPSGSDRLDVEEMLGAFSTTPVAYDVVVAPSVVVELVEQSQTALVSFSEERTPVAVSPVVLATAIAVDEQVADACGDAVTWTCAAQLTSEGALRPALRGTDDVSGLVGAAAMTGGFLENASFSANALGGSAFLGWVDAFGDARATAQPIQNVIQFNAAQANAGVELEATGLPTVTSSSRQVVNLSYPTPLAFVGVVAVAVDDADPDAAAEIGQTVGAALVDSGWRGPDGAAPGAEGVVVPPSFDPAGDDGLPNGGTLFSLRQRL
ncbi:hypothetical protein [Euzebya tangerina]|uniref:hypothetical protein n=1 Tax=Euzebya tangerina TaxID=591198 RepID=UPI000E31B51D|nr:hypothetical protein [Euzebya tangerina]